MAAVNPQKSYTKVCYYAYMHFFFWGGPTVILRFSAMCEPNQIKTYSLLWGQKEMGGGFRVVPGDSSLGQVEFSFRD